MLLVVREIKSEANGVVRVRQVTERIRSKILMSSTKWSREKTRRNNFWKLAAIPISHVTAVSSSRARPMTTAK
jgi:hypothetical protein